VFGRLYANNSTAVFGVPCSVARDALLGTMSGGRTVRVSRAQDGLLEVVAVGVAEVVAVGVALAEPIGSGIGSGIGRPPGPGDVVAVEVALGVAVGDPEDVALGQAESLGAAAICSVVAAWAVVSSTPLARTAAALLTAPTARR
jgi:hypothetical protein